MKARQESLHDEGWQSRTGKEGDAQKLDDVRVAEGAHKLTFSYELGDGFGQFGSRCPIPFLQDGVDGFGGGAHRNDYLLHFAVGSAADSGASELDVGENERPQPWMIAEKLFSHLFLGYYEPHPTFLTARACIIICDACANIPHCVCVLCKLLEDTERLLVRNLL